MQHAPPVPLHHQQVRNEVTIKVALLGDERVGKTSLMIKYVNNDYDDTYKKTLGVNFMNRNIELGQTDIKFSMYDLGGAKEFENMLPLAITDAVSIVLVFDLTKKDSLRNLKTWYAMARENKTAIPLVVGTKYDLFVEQAVPFQRDIHDESIAFARSINACLVFTSTSDSINIQKVFKVLISKAFDLQITLPEITNVGEPLLLYSTT